MNFPRHGKRPEFGRSIRSFACRAHAQAFGNISPVLICETCFTSSASRRRKLRAQSPAAHSPPLTSCLVVPGEATVGKDVDVQERGTRLPSHTGSLRTSPFGGVPVLARGLASHAREYEFSFSGSVTFSLTSTALWSQLSSDAASLEAEPSTGPDVVPAQGRSLGGLRVRIPAPAASSPCQTDSRAPPPLSTPGGEKARSTRSPPVAVHDGLIPPQLARRRERHERSTIESQRRAVKLRGHRGHKGRQAGSLKERCRSRPSCRASTTGSPRCSAGQERRVFAFSGLKGPRDTAVIPRVLRGVSVSHRAGRRTGLLAAAPCRDRRAGSAVSMMVELRGRAPPALVPSSRMRGGHRPRRTS